MLDAGRVAKDPTYTFTSTIDTRLLTSASVFRSFNPMDSALFRVPVEIWGKILSILIYPPLTPNANALDHIVNAKRGESERRNFRLVCKAWNAFADDEICLVDVSWTVRHLGAEAPMPLHYARRARVLSCHEDMIWGPPAEEILQTLHALVHEHTRMSVLSIKVCIHQFSSTSAEDILSNNKPGFSNLTHLRLITHLGYAPEHGLPCDVAISLPKLQVLEYHHSTPRSVEFLKWSLPALQRLSIGYLAQPEDLQAILDILALGGLNAQRLHSLTLVHPAGSFTGTRLRRTISPSLWASCPMLEEFAADFEKIVVDAGPPTNAALVEVIDTQEDLFPTQSTTSFEVLQFVLNFQRTWPSIRRARFPATRWLDLIHTVLPEIALNGIDFRSSWDRSIQLLDALGLDLFYIIEKVVKEIISATHQWIMNAFPATLNGDAMAT